MQYSDAKEVGFQMNFEVKGKGRMPRIRAGSGQYVTIS
jgi:hypothetical protein